MLESFNQFQRLKMKIGKITSHRKMKSKSKKLNMLISQKVRKIAGIELKKRDLQETFREEVNAQGNMEQIYIRNQRMIQKDIQQVKTNIGSLENHFENQFEVLRLELQKSQSDGFHSLRLTIKENQKKEVDIQRDMFEQLKILNSKLDFFVNKTGDQSESNQLLFEKLKLIANSNSKQIELITDESNIFGKNLTDVNGTLTDFHGNFQTIQQTLLEIDNKIFNKANGVVQQLQSQAKNIKMMRENSKIDADNIFVVQDDLRKTVEALQKSIISRVELTEMNLKQHVGEIGQIITSLQQEFQENLQNLASVHKNSTNQLILDFERVIGKNNTDIKGIFKNVQNLQSEFRTQSGEVAEIMQSRERKVAQQIQELSINIRQLKPKLY